MNRKHTHDDPATPVAGALLSRRQLLAAGAAAAFLLAAGCGSNDGGDDAGASGGKGGGEGSGREITHKYGKTTVPTDPQRIVTVGMVDHDAVLALGTVPVGITADEYSSEQPYGVWAWAREELGDATPEVLPFAEMNFEKIKDLDPDLILAIYSGITEEEFAKLTRIAPTVAQSADHDDYQTPWDEMTRVIGQALGKEDEAEAAIAGVEKVFADMQEAHPEFAGKKAVYAGMMEAGKYYAEGPGSTRAGILTGLGFAISDKLPKDEFFVEVSQEQLSLFESDLLLWEVGSADRETAIKGDELYQQLDVAKKGRDVFITDADLAGGLALISVLSLPFVIEALVPKLAAAVDGDPATVVPA